MPSMHRALRLVARAAGIDDLAADVRGHPHLVHLDLPLRVDAGLRDLGEVAEVAEVEGDAEAACPSGSARRPQPAFSATSFEHAAHAAGIEVSAGPEAPAGLGSRRGGPSRSRRNWTGSRPAAWASSSMNDCITNAMALLPGARSGPVGHAQRHERRGRVGSAARIAPGIRVGPGRRCWRAPALAEGHEVVRHATSLPAGSRPALEEMEARRPVEIVLQIIVAVPEQLHRAAGVLRDPGGLDHVVVRRRRPKPPPTRVMWMMMSLLGDAEGARTRAGGRPPGSASAPRFPPCRREYSRCSSAARGWRGR